MTDKPRYRFNQDGTFSHISGPLPSILVDDLAPLAYQGQTSPASWQHSIFDGGKFAGGFGPTQVQHVDYWTLRARSDQLFNENLYARGIVRRLVTNEINTGLCPEACPDEALTGLSEDAANDWSDIVETRFGLWGKNPNICDWRKQRTFGAIQRDVRMEALISGDVLCVMRVSQQTRMPAVDTIRGSAVQTPLGGDLSKLNKGHTIKHGVEFNKVGRIVAYWIRQKDLSFRRQPAFGEKSGKRLAWLVFGTDKRLDEVRGQPLLSLVLQSLKEIDRYRDATTRKAVINSMLAMFIKKGVDKPGTLPVQGGAVRKDAVASLNQDGTTGERQLAGQVPGIVYEELQVGEEPVGFPSAGTDEKFGTFEEAIIQAVAWCLEIPPEILRLSFSNNYSASQAAINEFKIAINRTWGDFGETFCSPVYNEWLITETLLQRIKAPGLLEAWRDPAQYAEFGAWIAVDWYGSIKPSTDMNKAVKASELLVAGGFSTRAREARVLTGTKASRNFKRLKRENEQLAKAVRPMLELQAEFGEDQTAQALSALGETTVELREVIEDG